VSLASPVYAEQVIDGIASRLLQALEYPQSGRVVPEVSRADVRELIQPRVLRQSLATRRSVRIL